MSIEHFIRLARVGKTNPGASGGEKRCCRLAECMLDNLPGLDGGALSGALEFLQLSARYPMEARELIEAPTAPIRRPLAERVAARAAKRQQ